MKGEQLSLEGTWASFEKATIPEAAPKVQREAMKMAFIAGCLTILRIERAARSEPLPHVQRYLDVWLEVCERTADQLAGIDEEKPH